MQIIVHLSQAAKYICIFASNFQKWIQGATFYAAWASLILFKNQINTLTYECCYDKYIQFFFSLFMRNPSLIMMYTSVMNNSIRKQLKIQGFLRWWFLRTIEYDGLSWTLCCYNYWKNLIVNRKYIYYLGRIEKYALLKKMVFPLIKNFLNLQICKNFSFLVCIKLITGKTNQHFWI